ncbi:MAG: Trk system potassium transporter TrkA [Pseudomonadota bacterium]
MKIVILGAGQVGSSVAEVLMGEGNDITIVDSDAARLAVLQNRFDLRTVVGDADRPSVLRRAGLEDTDLLIAITKSDQTNLIACKIAHSLFHVPRRIARLRSADFYSDKQLLAPENFAVDHALCPEQDVADYVAKLIQFPEALQVVEFANGLVSLVAIRIFEGESIAGKPIKNLHILLPHGMDANVAAVFRQNKSIPPDGEVTLENGDEVFLLTATANVHSVLRALAHMSRSMERVMIAGGGNIGRRVAACLQRGHEVKLFEVSRTRAEYLAGELKETLVLCGDATDETLLAQENISEMDMFLSLTNDDENNIMSALMAKRMGCKRVLALINRRAYVDMAQGGPIDIALSPAQVSIGSLLALVRRGDVSRVHSLRKGSAEALEIVAHGNRHTSRVVGRTVADLNLPPEVTIAALIRRHGGPTNEPETDRAQIDRKHSQVIIARGETVIHSGDHAIVFCSNKQSVTEVERLFQLAQS